MSAADLSTRAQLHAALGDPARLGIVEELAASDRTSSELAHRFGLPSNLLAHHVAVLEEVGLVDRIRSAGDRRRRYVRLRAERLDDLGVVMPPRAGRALFVCTHNSARSQLAAALWRARTGTEAASAGTHPSERVHPGAVAAAARAGIELLGRVPRLLEPDDLHAEVIVTVCDRAHEEITGSDAWLHWSIPDPAATRGRSAFDAALTELDERITALTTGRPAVPPDHLTT